MDDNNPAQESALSRIFFELREIRKLLDEIRRAQHLPLGVCHTEPWQATTTHVATPSEPETYSESWTGAADPTRKPNWPCKYGDES